MPYMHMQEDDQWAVYKKGPDGKPMGKALGKHKDEAGAKKQVAALYANESKEAGQDDSHEKMYDEPMAMYAPMGPTSFADLMAQQAAQDAAGEVHELTYQFQMLARNVMAASDVEDKAAAIETLAGEYAGLVRQAMEMKQKAKWQPLTDAAKKMIGRVKEAVTGSKPEPANAQKEVNDFFIWKDSNGTRRWFATYSNKYRDQDNPPEIISDASHRDFIKGVEEGRFDYPELWLWHVPGTRCGQADWLAYTDEGFALASGTFDEGKEAIADNLKEMGELLTSHGMPRQLIERDEKDNSIIAKHITREISPLPAWAAANKLTGFSILKELTMLPDEKKKFLKSAGLSDEQIESIEAGVKQKATVAEQEQLESKEGAEPETPATEQQPAPALDQEALAQAIAGAVQAAVVTAVTPIMETVKALEDEIKSLKETDEAKIAEKANKTPRASLEAMVVENLFGPANQIKSNSTLAKSGPKETPAEKAADQPFFLQWLNPGQ